MRWGAWVMRSLCAAVWARRESGRYAIWLTWDEGGLKARCMLTQWIFTEGLASILSLAYSVCTGMEAPLVRLLARTDGSESARSPLPRRRERFFWPADPRRSWERFTRASRKRQKVYTVHILFSG
ncbi:hypothetical protein DEGR_31330 [Deinococcus grandis]|nr:hypothetical protein DEGR_31330 [Deinococcus grandis]